jgi:hypothetical protein
VSLPVPSEPVPADVALWLFELRHYSDSNDVSCNSKVNVVCDSAAADRSYEVYEEEFQRLGLKKSGEENPHNCEVVQEHNTAEVSAPKDGIPGLPTQKEDYVRIHSKEEEVKNYHSVLQEYPENSNKPFLIQKEEVSVESHNKDEEIPNCHCEYLKNSVSTEDIPGLLIWKEEVCAETDRNDEDETLSCCCECLETLTQQEDISRLQQKDEGSVHSHKCDYDDVLGINISSCEEQGNGIMNTDESSTEGDNQIINRYGVTELPSHNQALTCSSILWEINPLYGRVGVGRSGKGSRKLCHSSLEQLGDIIHVGHGEEFELSSVQINEPVFANVIEERGVVCTLKTCSVCRQERVTDKCPLKFSSECGSFIEEACMETCQCGLDLNVDAHRIDSCGNQTVSSVTDVTDSEIYGKDAVWNCKLHQTELYDVNDRCVRSVSSSVSDCDIAVDCCPALQFQNPISECSRDDSRVTVSCGEKCEEVLRHLELIIQNLEVAGGDIPVDHEMVPDVDFLMLCQEAQNLAEETVQQCSVQVTSKIKKARSITLSSDLSDDVFMNSPSSEEHNVMHPLPQEVRRHHSLDINSIFDDGTKPPVPPARTKRRKEKSKTIHVTEGRIVDKTKFFATAPEYHSNDSASQLDETKLSGSEDGNENSLLDCQELLIMKRVTEHTKEKRSVKMTSHNEDKNLLSQGYQTHRFAADCDSTNVTIMSDDCSNPSISGKSSESFVPDDSMVRKPDDEGGEFLNIVLTQTRPISSTEFPPSQQVCSVSSSCDNRLQSEVETVETSFDESGILLQNRKGSTSSDIAAWKQELQHSGLCYLDDEWDADCMLQPDKVHIQFYELN